MTPTETNNLPVYVAILFNGRPHVYDNASNQAAPFNTAQSACEAADLLNRGAAEQRNYRWLPVEI